MQHGAIIRGLYTLMCMGNSNFTINETISEKMEDNTMKKVCVSLKELYNENGAQLHYGGYVDFYNDGETEYYDLCTASPDLNGSEIICCDGEECEVIHEEREALLLYNAESESRFYLTREEYDIAVFE